jgi:hypothetical protein
LYYYRIVIPRLLSGNVGEISYMTTVNSIRDHRRSSAIFWWQPAVTNKHYVHNELRVGMFRQLMARYNVYTFLLFPLKYQDRVDE